MRDSWYVRGLKQRAVAKRRRADALWVMVQYPYVPACV